MKKMKLKMGTKIDIQIEAAICIYNYKHINEHIK